MSAVKTILPPAVIGIIGGGQLGRMMALAAKAMGYRIASLDPQPGCPCAQIADIEIIGDYGDSSAIESLARASDVITYEFENINADALQWLEKNAHLPQGSLALKASQSRLAEKAAVARLGAPVPRHLRISGAEDLEKKVFFPSILKTDSGGYDGKGQAALKTPADLPAALDLARGAECVLEEWVPFDKEISVIVARAQDGKTAAFPVAENIHENGILRRTIAPARISESLGARAVECAERIAAGLEVVGILAVEMFVIGNDFFINEIAPRPHNSGHFTMDACATGQFEQHVRAVCALPLGDPSRLAPAVMANILGEHLSRGLEPFLPLLGRGKLHLYGKAEARRGRKMGHLNMLCDGGHTIDDAMRSLDESGIWN
ncbi:MAG: 5-(carboxyamino)imidazole ribonucleotide synthase [Treponema sp.]|nr:5-(carboxyamino)imidazole ribonucleotide synthase [Treponema sp.]